MRIRFSHKVATMRQVDDNIYEFDHPVHQRAWHILRYVLEDGADVYRDFGLIKWVAWHLPCCLAWRWRL